MDIAKKFLKSKSGESGEKKEGGDKKGVTGNAALDKGLGMAQSHFGGKKEGGGDKPADKPADSSAGGEKKEKPEEKIMGSIFSAAKKAAKGGSA